MGCHNSKSEKQDKKFEQPQNTQNGESLTKNNILNKESNLKTTNSSQKYKNRNSVCLYQQNLYVRKKKFQIKEYQDLLNSENIKMEVSNPKSNINIQSIAQTLNLDLNLESSQPKKIKKSPLFQFQQNKNNILNTFHDDDNNNKYIKPKFKSLPKQKTATHITDNDLDQQENNYIGISFTLSNEILVFHQKPALLGGGNQCSCSNNFQPEVDIEEQFNNYEKYEQITDKEQIQEEISKLKQQNTKQSKIIQIFDKIQMKHLLKRDANTFIQYEDLGNQGLEIKFCHIKENILSNYALNKAYSFELPIYANRIHYRNSKTMLVSSMRGSQIRASFKHYDNKNLVKMQLSSEYRLKKDDVNYFLQKMGRHQEISKPNQHNLENELQLFLLGLEEGNVQLDDQIVKKKFTLYNIEEQFQIRQSYLPLHGDKSYQINLVVQDQINIDELFVIGFANVDQLTGENQFLSAVNLSLDKLNYIQASCSNNDHNEEELKGNSQVNSSQNLRKKSNRMKLIINKGDVLRVDFLAEDNRIIFNNLTNFQQIHQNMNESLQNRKPIKFFIGWQENQGHQKIELVNSKQMFNKNSLLVHGPSGCGKSFQAQKLFNYIWKKQDQFQILHELYDVYYNFIIIPILINLNTIDDPYNNIVEQALKDPQQYNFSDEEVQKFKKDVQNGAYQVVFIIDGLSEMGDNFNKKNFFQMHKLDEWRQQNIIPKDQEQNKQNQQSLYQGQQALQQLQQNINYNDEQENIMNHNFPKIIYFVRTQSLVGGDYQKNYFIPTHQNFNQNIKNFKEIKVQKLDEHDINQYIQTYLLFQVKQKIANLYRSLVKNPKNIFKIIKGFNSFWKNLQIIIKKDIQYQESNNKLLNDQSIKYIIEQVITNVQSSKLLTDIHPQDKFILRLKKDLQEITSFENIENKLNLISGIRQKIQTYHVLEMCLSNLDQISLNFVKKQTNTNPESIKMNFFLAIQDKVLYNLQQYRAIVDYYQDSVIQQINPQKWERIMEFRQTMLPFQEQTLIRKITSEQISILWNLVLQQFKKQFKKISQNNQQQFSEQQLIECLEIVISQGKFSKESQQKQQDIDVYELLKNYLNNQIEQLRFLFKIKEQESDLYSTKNSKYISSKSNIDSKKHIGSDLSNKLNNDGSFIRDLKPTESNLLIKYMNYKIKFAFKMIANDTFQSFTFKKYNIIEAYLNQQRENNIQKIPNLSAQQQSELREKAKAYSIQLAQQFCKLGVTRVKITDQEQTQKLGTWILPNGEFQPFFPKKLTQQDKYIREICPFKIVNNHFSFSHKVFQDFFVAENLYEKLSQIKNLNFICSIIELYELEPTQGQNKEEFFEKLDQIIQDFRIDHIKEIQDFYSKYEEDININKVRDEIGNIQNIFSKIDIKVEPLNMDIFNFIGEKSFQDVQFQKLLLNIVKLSKFFSDNELQKSAAQSITILNQINFPLSAQNFNSVNIQGASLQGAQLSLTNFSKSNLNSVCLNDAFVDLANFKMSNVQKEHIQSLSQNSMNNSFQQQQKIQNKVISNQQKNNQDKNGYLDNLQDIYFHKADVNIEIGENENADQVLVTPDSQYLIITYPGLGLLKIHDMTVISQFISLPGQLAISRVDCTNDSKFLAFDFAPFKISRNQNIKIYNINDLVVEGRQSKYLELECKQGKVNTFKFTINQKFLIVAFENKIVQVWNFEAIQKDYDNLDQFIPSKISQQNRLVQSFNNFRGEIKTLDVYPFDKYFVTGGGYQESELKIWELPLENQIQQQNMISSKKQKKYKFELKGHRSTVTAVQFSKNGNLLVSASFDQTVRIWNVIDIFNSNSQEFQIHQTLSGVHKEAILSISLAFDDKFILSGGCDKGIIAQYRFFDLYRQKNSEQETNVYNKIHTISNGQVNCITYSQDNNFVIVSFDDKTVQVFKNYSYKNESELILQTVIKSQYKNSTSSNFTQLEGSVQLEGNFKQ